jgi:hypothetical protein
MSEEDIATAALLEYLNGCEAGIAAAKHVISQGKGLDKYDSNKIKWETAEGPSGPYERSQDADNRDFKLLVKDLVAHDGTLTKDGYFYWTFRNGLVVGRKKRA